MAGDGALGFAGGRAIEAAGVDQCSGIRPGLTGRDGFSSSLGVDHLLDRQTIRLGKGDVALVVGRHAHHGARAVLGQHVVGDPHRQHRPRQGVDHMTADGHPPFGPVITGAFDRAQTSHLLAEGLHRALLFSAGEAVHQLVFRCQHHVARPREGVGSGGEHGDRLILCSLNAEADLRPFRATDPVGLHGAHPFRPALEGVQVVEQRLGVVGDAQEPLIQLALFHQSSGAPGAAVTIHLLIGQHGLVDGIPVDGGVLAIGQPPFEQFKEQPLGPAVVVAVAGRLFAAPIDRKAKAIQLRPHLIDVAVGPLAGVHIAFDRRVFSGKSEGIPAHRMQHGMAPHALNPGDHIGDHVVAHMAHVQASRGVREHRQGKESGLLTSFFCGVHPIRLPTLLPALLQRSGVITTGLGTGVDGRVGSVHGTSARQGCDRATCLVFSRGSGSR